MDDRYRGYDVLAKRGTLSWNDKTREVVDARIAAEMPDGVLTDRQLATLRRVKDRICPEFPGRPPTTTLALVVRKIAQDTSDGFRLAEMPGTAEAWRLGLDAIDAEALQRHGMPFAEIAEDEADAIFALVESGGTEAAEWASLPPRSFWQYRLVPDLVSAHWAQPQAWSAMGFGGPASPRGYVRLDANKRDPWEAVEHGDTPRFGWPRRSGGRR